MKLRVKLDADPATVHRVEVGPAATVDELKQAVLQAIPALAASGLPHLRLSLNKKDELVAAAGTPGTLQQLGVCGGDTIWVLCSSQPATAAATTAVAPAIVSGATDAVAVAGAGTLREPSDLQSTKKARQGEQQAQQGQQQQQQSSTAAGRHDLPSATQRPGVGSSAGGSSISGGSARAAQTTTAAGQGAGSARTPEPAAAGEEGELDVPLEQLPNGLQVSPSLRRVLASAAACQGNGGPSSALGAAPPSMNPHAVLLCAVHAVMLECGFEVEQQGPISLTQAPRGWQALHRWPTSTTSTTATATTATTTSAPAMAAEEDADVDMVQALPAARIVATTVGPFLTLHCATAPMARGAAHTVHLDARQLLTASPAGAPGTAPLAAAAAAAATATSMPAAAPVVAAATAPMAVSATAPTPSISSPASTGAPAASGVVAAGDSAAEANSSGAAGQQVVAAAVACFTDLPGLWQQLYDDVALRLLSRCYQEAGLPTPVGLLMLPSEIKMQILGVLQARELAALCGVCSELAHLAASDTLWLPLFKQEFKVPTAADEANAVRRGWKGAFAARWRQRAERAAMARRCGPRWLPRVPPALPHGFVPPPPYLPGGLVIGGDYDRLPMPMLGQGPGMYNPPGMGFGAPGFGGPGFGGPGLGPMMGPRGGGALGGPMGPLQGGPFGGRGGGGGLGGDGLLRPGGRRGGFGGSGGFYT